MLFMIKGTESRWNARSYIVHDAKFTYLAAKLNYILFFERHEY